MSDTAAMRADRVAPMRAPRPVPGPVAGIITGVGRFAVHDGPGIRTTVFFKGCPLRCLWCHSPETQSPLPEAALRAERCLRCGSCLAACPAGAAGWSQSAALLDRARCTACGSCTDACPAGARLLIGRRVDAPALLATIERDAVFHGTSGGGVTFSGGEPLAQPALLGALIDGCRTRGLHTAVETSGHAPWRAVEIAARADLVLFDLKLVDETRHKAVTGVSNRRLLANFRRLAAVHPAVRVRLPLIPAMTDAPGNVEAIGRTAVEAGVRHVDLLPYHTAGMAKYVRLQRRYALPHLQPPSPDTVARAFHLLEDLGLTVSIGGGG